MIDYVPDRWLLESKSLKLFVFSFRNHGAFHEDCTIHVGKRIAEIIKPQFMRVASFWNPRGGIPIDVFWETGSLPDGVRLPDTGVADLSRQRLNLHSAAGRAVGTRPAVRRSISSP